MSFVKKRLLDRHIGSVSRARWTSDGKYVITCGHDKTLRLWNPFRSDPDNEVNALFIKVYEDAHHHEVFSAHYWLVASYY
jgi:WD40 repeat protein